MIMRLVINSNSIQILWIVFITLLSSCNSETGIHESDIKYYPYEYSEKPDITSPYVTEDKTELLLCKTSNSKFTILPVTVENGKPFNYKGKIRGKGNQLFVNEKDFPSLAKTGLHSTEELHNTISITERSIAEITMSGRPERLSGSGFMAADEDIVSVLLGDNELVKKMDLKHSDLAKTIFHLWNILQEKEVIEIESGISSIGIDTIFYNNRVIKYKVPSCRGWQYSLFNDSILGECHLEVQVDLNKSERDYILENYTHLSVDELTDFVERLTHIHTGEMVAYYIQMYGFYEGHTGFRADPVSLAYIFGLKSLQEIDQDFNGELYKVLTSHHVTIFE